MVVQSGTVLTTLDDVRTVRLDFPVPERLLAVLRQGKQIVAYTEAYPEREFRGTVAAVDSRVDRASRAVTVRATLQNGDDALRPGMLMRVNLVSGEIKTLAVPEAAVQMRQDQKYVFVVDGEGTARQSFVRIGRRVPGLVEIIEGLQPGTPVVVEGLSRVRDGGKVKVTKAPA